MIISGELPLPHVKSVISLVNPQTFAAQPGVESTKQRVLRGGEGGTLTSYIFSKSFAGNSPEDHVVH